MAAIDTWGDTRQDHDDWDGPIGPSDKEVVTLLQRVASARAQLAHAEEQAEQARNVPRGAARDRRDRSIELAHTDVLWAQANLITERRQGRALKTLRVAETRERSILMRYGYKSFGDYLDQRHATPTSDIHLELARREYAAAQESWEELQAAFAPTIVIDLTGDEPRTIV